MAKFTVKELEALTLEDVGSTIYDSEGVRGEVRSYIAKGINKDKTKGSNSQTVITVAFSYRYRFNSKSREIRLGVWPTTTLAAIRANRKAARLVIDSGKDPLIEKQLEKERAKQAQLDELETLQQLERRLTVSALFNKWEEVYLSKEHKDEGASVRDIFGRHVFPYIGHIIADEVRQSDIMDVVDTLLQRGVKRTAKYTFTLMRQLFKFAESRELVTKEPTSKINKGEVFGKDNERERTLDNKELVQLQAQLPESRLQPRTSAALWILLSTCCRVGELSKSKWEHIDFDERTWTIPSENSKNGKAHTVFLSDFALQQFQRLTDLKTSSIWVYPNTKNTDHVCEKSITKQVGDRQLANNRKPMSNRSQHSDSLKLQGGRWKPHDLRRTGATIMNALGVVPDVIEKCLNHTEPNKIKRTYQRYQYKDEQQKAFELLGDRLSLILNVNADNVRILKPKAVNDA